MRSAGSGLKSLSWQFFSVNFDVLTDNVPSGTTFSDLISPSLAWPGFSGQGSGAVQEVSPSAADGLPLRDHANHTSAFATPAPREVLVQFSAGVGEAERAETVAAIGGHVAEVVRGDLPEQTEGHLLRVGLPPSVTPQEAIAQLSIRPGVEFAEENWTVSVDALSNDAGYIGGSLWNMYGDATSRTNAFGSQAGEAWAEDATGSMKVVIGVIDTGIAYTHIDLYQNIWLNQREIPLAFRTRLTDADSDGLITFRDLNQVANAAFVRDVNGNGRIDAGDLLNDSRWENGIDDDANGYRDDLIGWDFVNNDNDPWDDNGHGTHVSGTIGAQGGNGTGVAGMAWNVQIVGMKMLGSNGSGSIANGVKALDYFTAASKANVIEDFVAVNNSWGGGGYSSAMQASIDRAAAEDILFVAAAGNQAANTDARAYYPAGYSSVAGAGYEAVISVAAITSTGTLASFSNYGAKTVDLGAPGASIYSTSANGGYAIMSGTSMAAPHVTGAIALYAAENPDASAAEIRSALLGSATATASLQGKTVTGGRLDAQAMLHYGEAAPPPPPPPAGTVLYGSTASDTIFGYAGNDTICGVAQTGTNLGRGTIDVLTGLGGQDVFILGDARGMFYDDGSAASSGGADYARIMDFQAGDKIQLSDDVASYFIRSNLLMIGSNKGSAIYADTNRNGTFDNSDELVGHVVNVFNLSASDFIFA